MKIKVLLIGGSGFIGTRLCDRLANRTDISFGILDMKYSEKYRDNTVICDIRDKLKLSEAMRGYDLIVNLAAEHKDNVAPVGLYYDVNVQGAKNITECAIENNIDRLIFTSSVAVYGFVEEDTSESGTINPFHDYGQSKWLAEEAYRERADWSQLSIIRPTVVFGEGNRGNVYNLLKQITSGRFLMIGDGKNRKSMAYVENVVAFIELLIFRPQDNGVYNYVDKPDFNMNLLVSAIDRQCGRSARLVRVPYWLGISLGYLADFFSKVSGKELPVSSVRIKKFCGTTQFSSSTISKVGFDAPVSLSDGLKNTIKTEFNIQ